MSNEIAVLQSNNLKLWDCPNEIQTIKEIYGKNLSNGEFTCLVQLGKATGLNPFLKELWAVKYGDNSAQIFIGRDGYRRSAQANPNYDYHHVEAVYSNDELQYSVKNGEVEHKQDMKNLGNLIGAYCIVGKKNSSRPIYVFVLLKEYSTGKSLWISKPATMIKKVAEAQCLRMAFQDLFGGTYAEEEVDITPVSQNTIDVQEHHKTFEGQPLSQSFTMDQEILEQYICAIESSMKKSNLQEIYKEAKVAAKGDKIASNKISIATKKRLSELQAEIDKAEKPEQTTEEWHQEYDGAETK